MKYFEKNAFKYNKPGHIKKFVLMDEKTIFDATLRQGAVQKVLGVVKGIVKPVPGGFYGVVKGLKKGIKQQLKGETSPVISGKFESGKFKLEDPGDMTIGGTIFKTPKGKSIAINKDVWRDSKKDRRKILAHEAFHANVPVLGASEIAAHFYGGLKSKKGKISLKEGIKQIQHLKETRPVRLYGEVGLAGTAGVTLYATKKKINT